MPQEKRTTPAKLDLLQGTLDLLVLQTLASMGRSMATAWRGASSS